VPNKFKGQLGFAVVSDFTAAEVNAATRAFVGVGLSNLAGQQVLISGWSMSVFCFDATDYARLSAAQFFIQRGLTFSESSAFPANENFEEQVVQFNFREPYARDRDFARPLALAPNYNYGSVLNLIAPTAPVIASVRLCLTLYGDQISTEGKDFPLVQR